MTTFQADCKTNEATAGDLKKYTDKRDLDATYKKLTEATTAAKTAMDAEKDATKKIPLTNVYWAALQAQGQGHAVMLATTDVKGPWKTVHDVAKCATPVKAYTDAVAADKITHKAWADAVAAEVAPLAAVKKVAAYTAWDTANKLYLAEKVKYDAAVVA
jgi:hypothetical protein